MDTTAKQARNEYYKQYRAKNKDRIKEINKRYWKNRASLRTGEKQEDTNNG